MSKLKRLRPTIALMTNKQHSMAKSRDESNSNHQIKIKGKEEIHFEMNEQFISTNRLNINKKGYKKADDIRLHSKGDKKTQ